MLKPDRRRFAILLATTLASVAGCGTSPPAQTPMPRRIETLAMLYAEYASEHGRGPRNVEEFLRYLKHEGAGKAARYGVTDGRTLLTSERDGKPFVVVYGIVPARPVLGTSPAVMSYDRPVATQSADDQQGARHGSTHAGCIVAYDAEGEAGQRSVVYLTAGGDPTEPEELAKQQVPGLR